MYRRAKLIFLLSLLLQLIQDAHNAKTSHRDVLAKDRLEEKFQLVGPRALLKNYKFSRVSDKCAQDLAIYERGLKRKETWALQMLDSSSKLPTGMLRGNLIDVGMYDECIEAHGISMEGVEIRGQHCMYSINRMVAVETRVFFDPMLSICLPKRCSNNDLLQLINGSIESDINLKNFGLSVSSATCTNTDNIYFDKQLMIFAIVMLTYIGFLIFCTAVHLKNLICPPEKRNEMTRILMRFSYLRMANNVFSLKASENDLPALHGIRVLNTFWLVVVHEVLFQFFLPLVNYMDFNKWLSSWNSLVPLMGVYSVDTFFVLSGFLTAFAYFKQRKTTAKFDIFSFYLHRILRLAPSVAAALYITAVLGPKLILIASGPRFDWLQNIFLGSCNSKWLSTLFFVPNLVDQDNYCLIQLWSVAVDVQLMWISPLLLFILYKKSRVGIGVLLTLVMSSALSYAFILGINRYSAIYVGHIVSIETILEAFQNIYEMPHTRASPWFLGILLGYIMAQNLAKPSKNFLRLGWLLAVLSFAFCILGTRTFTSEQYEYNLLWEITFVALSKPLWGFGVCWIIYATIYSPRGLIATMLSSKYYLPFSRISYSMCIVHGIFPFLEAGMTKTPRYFSQFSIVHSYIGNIMMDVVIALLFSITFEVPMRNFEKILFKKKTDVSQDKIKNK